MTCCLSYSEHAEKYIHDVQAHLKSKMCMKYSTHSALHLVSGLISTPPLSSIWKSVLNVLEVPLDYAPRTYSSVAVAVTGILAKME